MTSKTKEWTVIDFIGRVSRDPAWLEESYQIVKDRVERLNNSLHAFITVFSHPIRLKDCLRRPLAGAPVAVKDIMHVEGHPTTAGSKILKNYVAEKSAEVVERLLAAGGAVNGKTNLHEFAFGVTNKNPHYGDCINPWKRDRVSGGSSGGSAVAVATGMALAALGTDTAGSIRIPASLCGVYGFKPSYETISREGVLPLSWSLDHVGYLGNSVRDLALLTFLTARKPAFRDLRGFKAFRAARLKGLKVGVPKNYFLDFVEEDVRRNFEKTLDLLSGEGASLLDVVFPRPDLFRDCRHIIVHSEAAAFHLKMFRERHRDYGEDVRARLAEGLAIPASSYITALRSRKALIREFRSLFKNVDIIAVPTTVVTAPRLDASTVEVAGVELDVRSALLRNTEFFNVVGAPALAMPNGFSRDGLPTSIQLVSDIGTDWRLLSVGARLETLLSPSVSPWMKATTQDIRF
ncbi:Glutamyl-tRNA(Gln) amidotransferase subunit A [archaeon HR01]|nr:Glutamyl-tRNA(Gln) amidotransferase subunit A [archaeon HR01]